MKVKCTRCGKLYDDETAFWSTPICRECCDYLERRLKEFDQDQVDEFIGKLLDAVVAFGGVCMDRSAKTESRIRRYLICFPPNATNGRENPHSGRDIVALQGMQTDDWNRSVPVQQLGRCLFASRPASRKTSSEVVGSKPAHQQTKQT